MIDWGKDKAFFLNHGHNVGEFLGLDVVVHDDRGLALNDASPQSLLFVLDRIT